MVRLTKISSVHNNLRTDIVEGNIVSYPKVGERIIIIAPPLDKDYDIREVTTSPIKEIDVENETTLIITTENSIYRLEYLDDEICATDNIILCDINRWNK